jgi:hypothetical protein
LKDKTGIKLLKNDQSNLKRRDFYFEKGAVTTFKPG